MFLGLGNARGSSKPPGLARCRGAAMERRRCGARRPARRRRGRRRVPLDAHRFRVEGIRNRRGACPCDRPFERRVDGPSPRVRAREYEIAAIAPVAGFMTHSTADRCKSGRPCARLKRKGIYLVARPAAAHLSEPIAIIARRARTCSPRSIRDRLFGGTRGQPRLPARFDGGRATLVFLGDFPKGQEDGSTCRRESIGGRVAATLRHAHWLVASSERIALGTAEH